MPLEIIYEIVSFLPDAQTVVKLSCVCRQLRFDLAESQYIWYGYGSRKYFEIFRKFDPDLDYHRYIIDVIAGRQESICSICLQPHLNSVYPILGKPVCNDCKQSNIVLAGPVNQIMRLDRSKLKSFLAYFYVDSYNVFQVGAGGQRVPCYWLPHVKREAERAYDMPWYQITSTHLEKIRPLLPPNEMRRYYNMISQRIRNCAFAIYVDRYEPLLYRFLDPLEFTANAARWISIGCADAIHSLGVPAIGQTDYADGPFIGTNAAKVIDAVLGERIDGYPDTVRRYLSSKFPIVRNRINYELKTAGKRRGTCYLCSDPSRATPENYAKYGNRTVGSWKFIFHVQHMHPERLLNLDSEWKF
ncbi:hypothetical protein ABW21_db0205374 [Orbilia brochopaga]|nr:hypothetical protein ABW21_db0205374 [Drechslerella brochopaga]